jgi:hypothetical protein
VRIAIVSDIHGNFAALQAVVADLDRQAVDEVLVGGDLVQGGRQPAEVLDFLMDRRWPAVLGNADAFLLDFIDGRVSADDPFHASGEWAKTRVRPAHFAYLRRLPELIRRRIHAEAPSWDYHGVLCPRHRARQSGREYINRTYSFRGHFFGNRFWSNCCGSDAYALALIRYIHLNPCHFGIGFSSNPPNVAVGRERRR